MENKLIFLLNIYIYCIFIFIYNRLNITCSNDDNCPNHTYCFNDKYPFEHRSINYDCNNDDGCSSHCISHYYCKRDKSVCSFIQDEENEIRFSSKISMFDNIFGLENEEECKYNKECIIGHCGCGLYLIGSCREPSDSDGTCVLLYLFIVGPFFILECIIVLFILLALIEKKRLKRKDLFQSNEPFKCSTNCLTFTVLINGIILFAFYIYFVIHANLENQPL